MESKYNFIEIELNNICGTEVCAVSDANFIGFGKVFGANIGKRLNLDNFAASSGLFTPDGNGFNVGRGGAIIAQ